MSNVPARFEGTVNATLLPLIAIGAAIVKIFETAFVNVAGLANNGLLHLMLAHYY